VKEKKNKFSAALESYLENIQSIQKKYGAVRVTDLAEMMECKRSSVTSALRRLAKLKFINYEIYRPVTLTPLGESAVRKMHTRHKVLADFFQNVLLFPPEIADVEACRLEHRIPHRILDRLSEIMNYLNLPNQRQSLNALKKGFGRFLEQKNNK